MPNQTDVQQLIQALVPSGTNNGNPNTAYNQPRPSTPPPVLGADGWYLNTINPAANQAPMQLGWNPWQAPANSQQMIRPQWPIFNQPAPTTPGPATPTPTPGPSTPVPTTPVQPPVGTNTPGTPGTVNRPQRTGDLGVGGTGWDDSQGCVAIDQEIFGFVSPEGVEVGDFMPTVNPDTFEMSEHEVTYSANKSQPCVLITTESGAELKCSMSAPLLSRNGKINARDVHVGVVLAVQVDGMFDWSVVSMVEDVGVQTVRHITCGDQYFLAGNGNGKYVLHHNIKFDPATRVDLYGMMDNLNAQFGWSTNTGGFGAESMGSAPNTRGAMQSNGTWDTAHGGTASNPATAWGNAQQQAASGNYTPTGAGISQAFGDPDDPLSMYNSALGQLTGSIGGANPFPHGNLPTYSTNWMTPTQMPSGPAPAPQQSGGLGTAANWVDDRALGDVYNQDTGKMNWGNLLAGVGEFVTGLPINSVRYNFSADRLMTGSGDGSYAQNQFNRASPAQQQKMVENAAKEHGLTPEQALARFRGQ